ncbi:unnamed protein product [Didymodactylos carnosus]|uniref:EF-hand domain-containing protein n=1 Tax=Didymodactylos carnosus TaxID=1234261 RepID=A0A813TPY0_9BILA|nr:unnamed protein product [Didymodactylos carnosus]CAF3602400.1 unnamed protein product [Didymodactylos carnosus]
MYQSDPVEQQLRPDQLDEIRQSFAEFDINRNGYITPQEMKESLRRAGIQFEDGEVDRVISNMDLNKDGLVSYNEYLKFMARVYTGQHESIQFSQGGYGGQQPPYNQGQGGNYPPSGGQQQGNYYNNQPGPNQQPPYRPSMGSSGR